MHDCLNVVAEAQTNNGWGTIQHQFQAQFRNPDKNGLDALHNNFGECS